MGERAARSGIAHVHIVTWRDLDDPAAGGSEVHIAHLAGDLARAGLSVTVRTAQVGDHPDEIERDGFRVVRRGGRLTVFPTAARDLRRRRLGPVDGIIEVFHGVPFFTALWARSLPQVSIVHHVHLGTWRHLLPLPGAAVGHLLERFAVPVAYRHREIVTIAASTRDVLLRAYRADPDRVAIAECGVSDRFTPGGERAPQPLVVAVARMMPQKAIPDLLAAFARVRAAVPDARLVLVGEGPERPTVERTIRELGLTGHVECVGYATDEELVRWYQRAWVVASASLREGFGLTLTEAGACGTPAVARDIPGHVDAVVDGTTGLLAPDVAGLAEGLVRLLGDAGLRAEMGRAAEAHAARFRWERSSQIVLESLCRDADRRR
jgi:glycosyltransferase involved in cell wall biosynthesis